VSELAAAAVGLLAGVLAGIFGVGGGILFVPALVALGLEQHQATGTSLLAILPAVAAGTWRNAQSQAVAWRSAMLIGVAAAVSAQAGVLASEALPAHVLRKLFALLLLAIGVQIALRTRRRWRAVRHGTT
jgi:uncharacterized membrane protein YfcA